MHAFSVMGKLLLEVGINVPLFVLYKIWRNATFRNSPTLALQSEPLSQILTSFVFIQRLIEPSQLNRTTWFLLYRIAGRLYPVCFPCKPESLHTAQQLLLSATLASLWYLEAEWCATPSAHTDRSLGETKGKTRCPSQEAVFTRLSILSKARI